MLAPGGLMEHMTWEDVRAAAQAELPVVLAVGSTEQHGPHLPLNTDSIIPVGIAAHTGRRLPLVVAPPLRFGASLHYDQDRYHLGLEAFYHDTQDRLAANELPTESYTLVEANASYRLPVGGSSVFLFLKGTNLLDEDARQHTSPLKDIVPLPGRSWHFGARAEF